LIDWTTEYDCLQFLQQSVNILTNVLGTVDML